jgi:hypothetical protein
LIQPPIAVVIDQPRSVSVSEPIGGYVVTAPTAMSTGNPPEVVISTPLDDPLDDTNPIVPASSRTFRYLHLQRLADPTLEWNPEAGHPAHNPNIPVNPYRTIDMAPVPLVVFNGVADKVEPGLLAAAGLRTIQRGNSQTLVTNWPFWTVERGTDSSDSAAALGLPSQHNFDFIFSHSLGYLNDKFGVPGTASAYDALTAPSPAYIGAQTTGHFACHACNNRPFVGPME